MERTIRVSAKALVFKDECMLAIRLRDKDGEFFIMPGGGQHPGELLPAAVEREVEEESGVKAKAGKLIKVTSHAYRMYGSFNVKSIWWFEMTPDKDAVIRPQTEEGIEKCEWVTPEDLDYRLANTYPSIVDVFEAALGK